MLELLIIKRNLKTSEVYTLTGYKDSHGAYFSIWQSNIAVHNEEDWTDICNNADEFILENDTSGCSVCGSAEDIAIECSDYFTEEEMSKIIEKMNVFEKAQ